MLAYVWGAGFDPELILSGGTLPKCQVYRFCLGAIFVVECVCGLRRKETSSCNRCGEVGQPFHVLNLCPRHKARRHTVMRNLRLLGNAHKVQSFGITPVTGKIN